ncbi:hypothetical protein EMIT0194P_20314 [Pseudomonas serbica]
MSLPAMNADALLPGLVAKSFPSIDGLGETPAGAAYGATTPYSPPSPRRCFVSALGDYSGGSI